VRPCFSENTQSETLHVLNPHRVSQSVSLYFSEISRSETLLTLIHKNVSE
jgi:hypothetical protein